MKEGRKIIEGDTEVIGKGEKEGVIRRVERRKGRAERQRDRQWADRQTNGEWMDEGEETDKEKHKQEKKFIKWIWKNKG